MGFTSTDRLVSCASGVPASPIRRFPALMVVDPTDDTPFSTSSPEPSFTN